LFDFRFTLQNYSKIPPKKQASAKVQIFVAEKFCNKLESNELKKSYYKLFWSNQVGNQTEMAYYYPQIIQFFDANE